MELNIISVGNSPPDWVQTGINDYKQRFRKPWQLNFIDINTNKKNKNNKNSIIDIEGEKIIQSLPKSSAFICLDEKGKSITTKEFSSLIDKLSLSYSKVSFAIGGSDGIAPLCLNKANFVLSLGRLTLPHQVAKLLLVEQLYRVWSILHKHPYHRE